jgi:hypothetical protein
MSPRGKILLLWFTPLIFVRLLLQVLLENHAMIASEVTGPEAG